MSGSFRKWFSLKQQRCPRCGQSETLNRHSLLYGNDPARPSGRIVRGQRVYCSRRSRRSGCGRPFPVFQAGVLPRHCLPASLLWRLLVALLANTSVKAGHRAAKILHRAFPSLELALTLKLQLNSSRSA